MKTDKNQSKFKKTPMNENAINSPQDFEKLFFVVASGGTEGRRERFMYLQDDGQVNY